MINLKNLINESETRNEYIFKREDNTLFLAKRNAFETDKKVKRLTLSEIVDYAAKVDISTFSQEELIQFVGSLRKKVKTVETCTFSGWRSVFKIFNIFFNVYCGRGFITTSALANKLIFSYLQAYHQITEKRENATNYPKPIEYQKGSIKTNALIPTKKEVQGKGVRGSVYEHLKDSSLIVKKIYQSEYSAKFALSLDHPNIVKHHAVYQKKYDTGQGKVKIVMQKAEGEQLRRLNKLKEDTIQKLILQTQSACLYLFHKKIAWCDLHAGNLFIDPNKGLTIIDLDFWSENSNSKERALLLLIGAMEIMTSFVECSAKGEKFHNFKYLFQAEFFGISFTSYPSFFGDAKDYFDYSAIKGKLSQMKSDEEIETFLIDFFNAANKAFSNA